MGCWFVTITCKAYLSVKSTIAGWQITISDYCRKIDRVISTMFHLRGQVKPANRAAVDQYLLTIWESVMTFTHSFQKHGGSDSLRAKFKPYVAAEEDRLRRNMEEIRYVIDDQDTVALITGPGRIEMVCNSKLCFPQVPRCHAYPSLFSLFFTWL